MLSDLRVAAHSSVLSAQEYRDSPPVQNARNRLVRRLLDEVSLKELFRGDVLHILQSVLEQEIRNSPQIHSEAPKRALSSSGV